MSEAARPFDDLAPDLTHVVTEDDEPLDNQFSEKQQRLLTRSLYANWSGRQFVAMANVGLFHAAGQPPVVPDMLLSLGVEQPQEPEPKANRSYFIWLYGKPPELVVEVVSNTEGGEDTTKLEHYCRIRVSYYVIHDPFRLLSQRVLRCFRLAEGHYVEMLAPTWLPDAQVGLCLWTGEFEGLTTEWLRFCDEKGQVLATGLERAERERERADTERERADTERERADRMAERLRELGVEPD